MSVLERLFPRARLTANRIERSGRKRIERFVLDAASAGELGREQVGVLVCQCEPVTTLVRCLRQLDVGAQEPSWILMADAKERVRSVREIWLGDDSARVLRRPDWDFAAGQAWGSAGVLHGTPESVTKLVAERDPKPAVGALFLLDPKCHVHHARGMVNGPHSFDHDRPQIVADLRTSLAIDDWSPPLFILTHKEPGAVDVETLQRCYFLEALRYLDGRTLLVRP